MLDVCVSPCYESTRSSYQRCFLRKGVLRKDPEARSFIKKEALKQIFNFSKFLRTPFLENTSERLLLLCLFIGNISD